MLPKFVNTSTLSQLLSKGIVNREGVRLLDCSYSVSPKLDYKRFKEELYGHFKTLQNAPTISKKLYLSGHIPEAVHMSLDAAMYPSQYERFAMYPPDLFQEYIRLLGINKGEHVILYSRGPIGGMLFAGKCAWLFKSYGHEGVSVLDGGFAQWEKHGLNTSTDDLKLPEGNWESVDKIREHTITFDELTEQDADDVDLLRKTNSINFLDSRIRGQFEGTEDTGLDPYQVSGSHIPGFKNCPTVELVTKDGLIKSDEQIKSWLDMNGYHPSQPVITNCNIGMQASLLSYAIEDHIKVGKPRLYCGSLKEIELREPKKISAGHKHIP